MPPTPPAPSADSQEETAVAATPGESGASAQSAAEVSQVGTAEAQAQAPVPAEAQAQTEAQAQAQADATAAAAETAVEAEAAHAIATANEAARHHPSFHSIVRKITPLKGHVVVVGSSNIDYVVDVKRMPRLGETVKGGPLRVFPGGKSGNQAVAAALVGAPVSLVAAVGDDENGNLLLKHLRESHVNVSHVQRVEKPTSTALITVDANGDNTIVSSAGSNDEVNVNMVEVAGELIGNASLLGLALEMPLDAAVRAVEIAHDHSTMVVLNPSPMPSVLPGELLDHADVLILNEGELVALVGEDLQDWDDAAAKLRNLGVARAIVTLGAQGSMVLDNGAVAIDAPTVQAVDTTGCGDAFMGAILAALGNDASLVEAAHFGSYVAAYAAEGHGAQASYGTLREIEQRFSTTS